ncbi:MAG: acetate--CoA ligase family protein [Candidatus Ranarchaeia archaeon]
MNSESSPGQKLDIDDNIFRMFHPRSVAIVGASSDPTKIGHALLRNIIEYGFEGHIYPINPRAKEILGLKAFPSLSDTPTPPDLVFLAISSKYILSVLEEAGKIGSSGTVIITAGFGETGETGQQEQKRITEIAKKFSMRVIGPNVLGIVNTSPSVKLNAIFVIPKVKPGPLAFISQSGALGNAILGFANRRRLGISLFASIGNMADVSFTDLLPLAAKDEQTKVIMLYIEMMPDARKFLELAARIGVSKPLVAIKAGRTKAGSRATQSHTASLAGSDQVYEAAFRQYGIYRAEGVDELFDVSKTFAWQPGLQGDGIGIVTNSGGPGILVADAIERTGLTVAKLSPATLKTFKENLPPMCAINNQIDLVAAAGPENYAFGLKTLLEDPNISGCVVIVTPPDLIYPQGSLLIAKSITDISLQFKSKPVLGCWMGGPSIDSAVEYLESNHIPNFPTSLRVAKAMAALRFRHETLRHWREKA